MAAAVDENNVDLNRNFLLAGEPFEGCPPGYAELNDLLNPQRPPMNRELFKLKALWMIAKLGMPALRQSVAGGQYDFPQGLFLVVTVRRQFSGYWQAIFNVGWASQTGVPPRSSYGTWAKRHVQVVA